MKKTKNEVLQFLAGLLARNLFVIPKRSRNRGIGSESLEDFMEKELRESRQQLRDIEAEIEKLKKDK